MKYNNNQLQTKIKIFNVVNSLKIGGLEQVLVNIINSMDASLYEHVICCIDTLGPMKDRLEIPCKIYNLAKGANSDYFLPFKIAQILRLEKVHIVHTRNWSAIDGVFASILAGVKIIIHDEHGRDVSDPSGSNLKRKIIRKMLNPWVSRFIPVSTELEKWLVNDVGIPIQKVQKIINGVDTDSFYPRTSKDVARSRYDLPSEAFIIGYVGRMDPVKDITTLLKAFALFIRAVPTQDVRLLIVGDGQERVVLQQKVNDLNISGQVQFTGERHDVPTLMQAMDILAISSIAEGIPMTIIEAMATGLPVIATKVGGLGELIEHGVNGYLVSAGDAPSIAALFEHYYKHPDTISEHGKSARLIAENRFSLKRMVATYEELYKKLIFDSMKIVP